MAPWARHYTMDKIEALRHPNPRVRRRLFDTETTQHTQDNLDNILQESRQQDRMNMREKWNFDFDNEEPLDGKYQWYKLDNETWVSVEPKVEKENWLSEEPTLENITLMPVETKLGNENWVSTQSEESWISAEREFEPIKDTEIDIDMFEKENQITPRINKVDIPPELRKRKRDGESLTNEGAKRKITFD